MAGRTRSTPVNQHEILCRKGDELKERWGEVRYIDYTFHNGKQWTKVIRWEYKGADGIWHEIAWPDDVDDGGSAGPAC